MSRVWRDDKDKDLSNDDIAQKSLGRKAFCHFHQSMETTSTMCTYNVLITNRMGFPMKFSMLNYMF